MSCCVCKVEFHGRDRMIECQYTRALMHGRCFRKYKTPPSMVGKVGYFARVTLKMLRTATTRSAEKKP